jgi:hypothetical protein
MDLVLVKSLKDFHLYSYCWACGAMWRTPSDAYFEANSQILDPTDHMPEGFSLPSPTDIMTSGFFEDIIQWKEDEFTERHFRADLLPK